jgi:signal transduction histidine kinase
MKGFVPRSLVGQMAVLIGVALLLAQIASFGFVIAQRQQFNRAQIDTPAITRFTSTVADFAQAAPEFRRLVLTDSSRRGAHYELANAPSVPAGIDRRADTEQRLRQSLRAAGVAIADVRAAIDPRGAATASDGRRHRGASMLLATQLADKQWINARLAVPAQPRLVTPDLVVGTLLFYVFVLSAAVFIAMRLARPLRDLTRAAETFRGRNEPLTVAASGPSDLRNAILAFNAMNQRLVLLLEEKDRTLGAIGHDLRTPLASLRIRAESVDPEQDRERMIATIEEMTATLDDILTLARSGRSREQFERSDVSSFARSIVDDYCDLGKPVAFVADGPHVASIQANLLRRALRNLIDNALNYGASAEVAVKAGTEAVLIEVADRGPGLPPLELERIAGAFYRGEPSRNRETGGAGLGLSIAEAVVDSHGGWLSFANREGGGLSATIGLPA